MKGKEQMDEFFSLRDFELMMDCVYFASKNFRLTWYHLKEKQKELDALYLRMVDAHEAMNDESWNA